MRIASLTQFLRLPGALFLAAVLVAGCGKSEEKAAPVAEPAKPPVVVVVPAPAPAPAPVVVVAPKPDPKPAAAAPAPAKQTAAPGKDWQLLGQQRAEFKRDRDRLVVTNDKGAYREIQIRVKDAPLEMDSVVVTFSNGDEFKPQIKHHFDEKSGTRAIDLPGAKRVIKHVDFVYRSANRREGAALVQLYGR